LTKASWYFTKAGSAATQSQQEKKNSADVQRGRESIIDFISCRGRAYGEMLGAMARIAPCAARHAAMAQRPDVRLNSPYKKILAEDATQPGSQAREFLLSVA
jgi:hypothetical protein